MSRRYSVASALDELSDSEFNEEGIVFSSDETLWIGFSGWTGRNTRAEGEREIDPIC